MVLRAQRSDWQRFRAFQKRIRRYYRNKPFSDFVNKARQRRQRHELGGNIYLLPDLEQQSRLDNWTEFQDYHLQSFEGLGKERDGLMKELNEIRDKGEDVGSANHKRAMLDAESIQRNLVYAERNIESHRILLQWIETKRSEMDTRD